MKDLSNAKIVKYDSMLEEITLFSFQDFAYSDDGMYYIQSNSRRLGDLSKLWIKLKPISYHYESIENETFWTIRKSYQPLQSIKALLFIRFKIVGAYYSFERLTSKSKMNGFSRVIDDNNYFSRIPLVNEVVHWDNGVIITPNYQMNITGLKENRVEVDGQQLLEDWATFKINVSNDRKGVPRTIMTAERGHEHL
ncbi:Appendage [Streptococcus phage CP-7]|uniref:Appendage n=1 Tax=Streptococcus phage Cp-7 TaxID=10748 RepID=A0A068YNW1_BPCP7|nr:Appendage [Streptococcus phage CP-7]CDS43814.1 Appendage [Streptococcus phage CP-7]